LPDDKGETCGNIAKCALCDLFGFMTTIKGSGAVTRVSPVKVSPAIGLLPLEDSMTLDFLTRHKAHEEEGKSGGDIVNIELSTNIYKCGLAVDLTRVTAKEQYNVETMQMEFVKSEGIDKETPKTRIAALIKSLSQLTDMSKQSRLLTDFSPDIICTSTSSIYDFRLQKLFELVPPENGEIILNIKRMAKILAPVVKRTENVYAAVLSSVVDNEDEVEDVFRMHGVNVLETPEEVLEVVAGELEKADW